MSMTVAQLITELQRMPQGTRVRVNLGVVTLMDEGGESSVTLSIDDAAEVDFVQHQGPFVLIQGR